MKISWMLTGLVKKNKKAGRERLMSVNIQLPMPKWCRWLTQDTLKSLHDYCWINNIHPDRLNTYTDEQWKELAGQRIGQEIIDAINGTREMEEREREKKALAEKKRQEEQAALEAARQKIK
ncbi:MAG: hypothetical protein ACOYJI_03450 [Anaerovoracaceae bacterium]|jgi:hypothetical protein